ncbi:hypothetical protein F5Y10DRAFT_265082 [Nemania abortiva]|nr:hypothetical protein F5Y10DRAFT_265082 [Nemania abortiva]
MPRIIRKIEARALVSFWLEHNKGVINPSRENCYCGQYRLRWADAKCTNPEHYAFHRDFRCGRNTKRKDGYGEPVLCRHADYYATYIIPDYEVEGHRSFNFPGPDRDEKLRGMLNATSSYKEIGVLPILRPY